MQMRSMLRILGILLMIFSLSMVPPIFVADYYKDGGAWSFFIGFIVTAITGLILWILFRQHKKDLRIRDGFFLVVLFWLVLSIFGALPLAITEHQLLTFTEAVFESVSGLTTTGATVISGINFLPHAILYYRQQLQFLGGMGIIVLAIAILPMLGVGGMQLYRAETPGPVKDTKLTPRIAETAKALWYIYVGLTVLCMLAYWIAGMSLFDAIGEAFGTVATGGFSLHDSSFAYYHSHAIDLIAVVFMILSATNFRLHYFFLQQRDIKTYWKDLEFRTFIKIILVSIIIVFATLMYYHVDPHASDALYKAIFTVTAIATTTGLSTVNIGHLPSFIPLFLVFLGIIGGCAASTAGGLKVIRVLLLQKQGMRELKRLIHPRATLALKFGNNILPENVIQAMWGFVAIFFLLFFVLLILLVGSGVHFETAFAAVSACIVNVGDSIAGVSNNFSGINPFGQWVLIFAMLAGRLEIFTLVVLFTKDFWEK